MYWNCKDLRHLVFWNISPHYNMINRASSYKNSEIEIGYDLIKEVERCLNTHGDYLWVAQYKFGLDEYNMFSIKEDFQKVIDYLKNNSGVENEYPYTFVLSSTKGFDVLRDCMDGKWNELPQTYYKSIILKEFYRIAKKLGFQGYFMGMDITIFYPNDLEFIYGDFISKALEENPDLLELKNAIDTCISIMDNQDDFSYDSLSKDLSNTILNLDMRDEYQKNWQKRQFDSISEGMKKILDSLDKTN